MAVHNSAAGKEGGVDASANNKPAKKKTYHAPSFRFERVFEVMALSCGKVGATQESCRLNRKLS
ncbi:MAG TPA: hypothetical protein VGU63_16225 [Candidatus Acidoferrales bacterium]|nr:hypothetical protein [Candidatus Acidoferrales bacterium]